VTAVQEVVRELLPDDEPVVVRYIVIVAVLLTQVAYADGVFLECELDRLRQLFEHIDRMPKQGIDRLCKVLNERVPHLTEREMDTCYHELKSLCDGTERLQVMRLLANQATADGKIVAPEHGTLATIAAKLAIPLDALEAIEHTALQSSSSLPRDSASPPPPSEPTA